MSFDRTKTELERSCRDGELIVAEGQEGREMFVIQSGRVRITKQVGGQELHLATLDKGDFFGEMGLLETMPRVADVHAIGITKLLVIQPGGLLMRIRRDPTFAFEMLHRLSARLRRQNARLVEAIQGQNNDEDGSSEVLIVNQKRGQDS